MFRFSTRRFALVCLALGGLVGAARANSIIDFELRPDGTAPRDNLTLSDPYTLVGGGTVRFFFDRNGNNAYDPVTDSLPVFEKAGRDGSDGFVASTSGGVLGASDLVREGSGLESQLGEFFVRQPAAIGVVPGPFLIVYDTAQEIREFSGEIWDIDGNTSGEEQWRVEVLNASGGVLASLLSPRGTTQELDSLDSLPWAFGFNNLPDGVKAIRLTFVGSKATAIGLAFNNFSPLFAVEGSVPTPEPSSLALLGLGSLAALAAARRRRRG